MSVYVNDPALSIDVKAGPGAQFTDPQRVIYPMVQVGGDVFSPNRSVSDVVLVPGELLPALDVYVF